MAFDPEAANKLIIMMIFISKAIIRPAYSRAPYQSRDNGGDVNNKASGLASKLSKQFLSRCYMNSNCAASNAQYSPLSLSLRHILSGCRVAVTGAWVEKKTSNRRY